MKHPQHLRIWMIPAFIFTLFGAAMSSGGTTTADSAGSKNQAKRQPSSPGTSARLAHEEQVDRAVDSAAIASQENAIAKLKIRVKQAQRTPREPILISRLADLQAKLANSIYRVEHGKAQGSAPINLQRYQALMREMIGTLNDLIARYPKWQNIRLAYFARAKALREVGDSKTALAEFLEFTVRFSGTPEVVPAHIYAAEIAMEKNDFPTAIQQLVKAAPSLNNPHYPFVQEKLATSYFNVNDYPHAIQHAVTLASYHRRKLELAKKQGQSGSGYQMQIESALQSVTLFYATAVVAKTPGYTFNSTLEELRKIESGPYFGKMLHQYSVILRARGTDEQLIQWKDLVLSQYASDPEMAGILHNTYEAVINWKKYDLLIQLPKDVLLITQGDSRRSESLNSDPAFIKLKASLIESAEKIYATLGKNPTQADHLSISPALNSLLTSYLQITDSNDSNKLKVRYRLGDHYFSCRQFRYSTAYFAWIFQGRDQIPVPAELQKLSQLKAIASRFEELREAKLIPEELQPKAITTSQEKLPPLLAEWVKWVDETKFRDGPGFESFEYQEIRAIYAQGGIQNALARMINFIEQKPKSEFSPALASLATDTTIVSQDWEQTYTIASRFLKLKDWNAKFIEKLTLVASDAYFKLVELAYNSKNYEQSFEKGQQYLTLYPNSRHFNLCLGIVGSSALALQKPEVALPYFESLIQKDPKSIHLGNALLTRASQAEKKYQFSAATRDYLAIFALKGETPSVELRRKVLLLSFLSEDPGDFKNVSTSKIICSDELLPECDRYEALSILQNEKSAGSAAAWYKRGRNGYPENKVLWMTLALSGTPSLGPTEQEQALKVVISELDRQDGLYRYAMVQSLVQSIPRVFKSERAQVAKTQILSNRLELLEKGVKMRLEAVKAVESLATRTMDLNYSRIRAQILNEVAGMYADFSQQIRQLKPPKGFTAEEKVIYQEVLSKLAAPLDEKKRELRRKAFELASESLIERPIFAEIAKAWEQEFPTEAEKLVPMAPPPSEPSLSLKVLTELDPLAEWQMPSDKIQSKWFAAIKSRHWARVAFFATEARKESKVSETMQLVAKAVSLAAIGTQSEGLREFKEAHKKLPSEARAWAGLILMNHAFSAYSQKEARHWLEKTLDASEDDVFRTQDAALSVKAAAAWLGVQLDSSLERKIRAMVSTSQEYVNNPWMQFKARTPANSEATVEAEVKTPANSEKRGTE